MTMFEHGEFPATSLLAAWLDRPVPASARDDGPAPRTSRAEAGGEGTQPPDDARRAESCELPPPGVEAVVDALTADRPDPEDVAHGLTVFAWERAATGDLTCVLDELDELWDVLEASAGAPLPREAARHRLVDAWVDAVAAERGSPGVDPLSGLHTVGYLYGRVQELDRLSGIEPMALVLLVMRWDPADGPWRRIARVLQAASALRSRVRPEATLSQVGTTMALALVPDDAQARVERIALTKAVETGELSTAHVRVDVFAVPDSRARLPELVTGLLGGANVDHQIKPPRFRRSGSGSLD
ncbi:hypothetical protein [Jiangella rhizosphaerae]|uniref:Uncharacterized protein n=1 Tax=Jiangella rhizosphaerae TaxID=2293569 RepID=A0A418KKF4_9ACTN|nr:hypothetical protein [Jiangella rhizosphaerae]RIQ16099.1 hypothetical protein DY240_23110 [Jiangella rhizosphaerae]